MVTIFFSYSHCDQKLCEELEKHFSSLCDEGKAVIWLDERVEGGEEYDPEIIKKLKSAEIILLLISADFLASNSCKAEAEIAAERHDNHTARVIPVILRSCDWENAPFGGKRLGEIKAFPTDGKPVVEHEKHDQGFHDIVRSVRQIVESISDTKPSAMHPISMDNPIMHLPGEVLSQSGNLRIEKEITDPDRHEFLTNAFNYIARYFENSLRTLQSKNENVKTKFQQIDANTFEAIAFVNGHEKSRCGIWLDNFGMPGISRILFSHDGLSISGSHVAKDIMSLSNDGSGLYLELMGRSYFEGKKKSMLTQEDAAKYYWNLFREKLK